MRKAIVPVSEVADCYQAITEACWFSCVSLTTPHRMDQEIIGLSGPWDVTSTVVVTFCRIHFVFRIHNRSDFGDWADMLHGSTK